MKIKLLFFKLTLEISYLEIFNVKSVCLSAKNIIQRREQEQVNLF